MSKNHYQTLGVSATAPAAEVKLAYKRLAVRFHPDKHGGSTQFEEQFKAVTAAYHVLGDPARRAAYDHQLRQEVRRAEDARRQQQYRPQSQYVYGVPMPPPAPLRTRRPAGAAERHYQRIPKQRARTFTRRDFVLTAALLGLLGLFIVSVKVTMDHVTAVSNYEDGVRAYARRQWSTAHSLLSEAIHFKPDYGPALRRRGELAQLVFHDFRAARADYQAALPASKSVPETAELLFRLGQCQASLGRPDSAELNLTRAVTMDSTLSAAWLARGELRLFELRVFPEAIQDFNTGLRQRLAARQPLSLRYLTYRGLAHYKQRDFAAARADYRRVLENSPRNGQVCFLLGRLAQQEGNGPAACEFFRRAEALGYLYAAEARRKSCR
ncbi:Tetratricopeptide repeat-containing protein [Hymenobacter daecheongensis DSM 21074]|uniref:Tetratricopeptide repeat-containing protein n=1 Tax=Hymenobacter daecheongensis DSM 21074 TaxID=1121955 RepID=A0A1M6B5M6_9BACT|nr:J domain-containing protein [Hymenobacter daecheongensis]SHI44069.1 Tetratricopeptide repeat-containing protein [Hymenobacter daecheongensis DSM 21074]